MGDRIAITGLGVVSDIGIGREAFASALTAGRSGIGEVTAFDVEPCRSHRAAEIIDLDVNDYLESQKNYLDRHSELAFAAAKLALDDAALAPSAGPAPRFGICLGTVYGNVDTTHHFYDSLVEKSAKFVSPFLFQHTYSNTTASLLAIEYALQGVHANFCSGAAAGLEAVLYAADSLRLGRADAMLAGGVEALSEAVFMGMDAQDAEAVPGEGAALLLLETEDHARQRGAARRGTILGGGMAGDLREAIDLALAEAALTKGDVDAVFGAGGDLGLSPRQIDDQVGDTIAASGPLLVAAALASDARCALVNVSDGSALSVSLLLGKD